VSEESAAIASARAFTGLDARRNTAMPPSVLLGVSKYERAAMRWLHRYLDEKSPTLKDFAKVVRSFGASELNRGSG
jgi:hypothetical protein